MAEIGRSNNALHVHTPESSPAGRFVGAMRREEKRENISERYIEILSPAECGSPLLARSVLYPNCATRYALISSKSDISSEKELRESLMAREVKPD